MALIDCRCLSCGVVSEAFRLAADWPKTPHCPSCGADTEQTHLPKHVSTYVPAVVVFKAPDGTFRVPGETDGSAVAKYEQLGYTRIDARGFSEVRRLEQQMNAQQASAIRQRIERHAEAHEAAQKARRSEFHNGLANGMVIPETVELPNGQVVRTGRLRTVRLSAQGRDLARVAIARTNAKGGPKSYDPGCHIEVYSYDRSNRDESRNANGKRYRD
jgi:hypothetical protein